MKWGKSVCVLSKVPFDCCDLCSVSQYVSCCYAKFSTSCHATVVELAGKSWRAAHANHCHGVDKNIYVALKIL